MVDFASFQYNNATTYPLSTSTSNPLLLDADPALYYTLDYFQSVLTTHMGSRLVAEAMKTPAIAGIASPIGGVCPFNPDPYLTENQFAFPLLAVYRNKAEYEDVTVTWPHEVGEWTVQYILPPLNAGQMERVGPILNSVPKILQNRIENKMDPLYQSGANVWALAGLESIKLIGGAWSRYEATGNLVFPCWTGKLLVKERVMLLSPEGFDTLAGIDNEEQLAATGTTTVPDFVDTKSDF